MFKHFVFITFLILLLSACSSRSPLKTIAENQPKNVVAQTITQRNQQMRQLLHWSISGKIAFIEKNKKRQSATLKWTYNASNRNDEINNNLQQQIDLTTFLGINLLHLESNNNKHLIKVNRKKYQGNNLNTMIYRLTGFKLPTKALSFWLKGIAYKNTDKLSYQPNNNKNTSLPLTLESDYYQQKWHISYDQFKLFNGYQLPTKLTIKQADLTIKIAINQWGIL